MKIHTGFVQGDPLWLLARAGLPTASEFDALVSPTWKIKEGKGPHTYLCEKLAEAWQGGPLPQPKVFAMEMGNILEDEAIPWLELEYGIKIDRPAFITTDDGRIGCSPDGIISGTEIGVEVKAPQADTQVRYLLDGKLPDDYVMQVHGSMLVTGFKKWKFLSYRRKFSPMVLTIERDEEKIAVLQAALDLFLEQFDEGMKRLCEINGGPPRRLAPYTPKKDQPPDKPKYELQTDDIPT